MAQQQKKQVPFLVSALSAGTAASVAEAATLPFDTAKVRMQIQGSATSGAKPYKNIFDALSRIVSEEGPLALWKGLSAGVQRQMVFASLRIGMYEPIRNFYHQGAGDPPLSKKILAGLTTGAIGISIANPTDVVKVRLQAEGRLPPGTPRQYNGSIDAYRKIIASEGVLAGLWRGVVPNIVRNAVITAAELASYDQLKQIILSNKIMGDHTGTHLVCGLGAGFIATVVGSPVDVIKTRVMNSKAATAGSDPTKTYSGTIDCAVKTLKYEGPSAFYKGFWANFTRIGTWNVVMFIAFEKIKAVVAEQYNK